MSDRKLISSGSPFEKANGYSRELAEHALSHVYEGAVERAYTVDGDPIELRRSLMQAWADYLDQLRIGGNVVALGRKAS